MRKSYVIILSLLFAAIFIPNSHIEASEGDCIQIEQYNIEKANFTEMNEVGVFYDKDNLDVSHLLEITENKKASNTLNLVSDTFGDGGILGFYYKEYMGKAMGIWVPDPDWNDEDKRRLEEKFPGDYWKKHEFVEEQFKKAKEQWNNTDWDLENSYYQVEIKLPKTMTVDKNYLEYNWSNDKFLAQLYDGQEPVFKNNRIIFKAKFKTLNEDIALNSDSRNWNKEIFTATIPVSINYQKGTFVTDYVPVIKRSVKIVDKSGAICLQGSGDTMGMAELFPMAFPPIDFFPVNQKLGGDILVNGDNTESDDYYFIEKNKPFDITTKLNVEPIKNIVTDPFGAMGYGDMGMKFGEMHIFRFWPALNLGSVFSTTLRFPKEFILPDNLEADSLKLIGSNDVFYVSKVERSIDPLTEETILKIEMPLTVEGKRRMPSLFDLSHVIGNVNSDFYLTIPKVKLSEKAQEGELYTVKGDVNGKVFFTFITDIDDWVANEYKEILQKNFGEDIVEPDDIWTNVMHFNMKHPNLEKAVDYMLKNYPEIYDEVIPGLLIGEGEYNRGKYDTNVYSLFVNWLGEQEPEGRDYLHSQNGGDPDDITLTVSPIAKVEGKTINVSKEWRDEDNYDGLRPDEIEIKLLADGEKEAELRLSRENNWKGSFKNLPLKNEKGEEIQYTLEEEPIEGYKTEVLGNMRDGFTIVNTHIVDGDKHYSGGGGHSNYIPNKVTPSKNDKLNMKDHYAYMFGYPEKDFRAGRSMTRGEVAAMFSRLMKTYPEKGHYQIAHYGDIQPADWFFEPIEYMRETGVVSGYPDGTFRGNAPITRAEFATIAARFDKLVKGDKHFSDVPQDFWAEKYISSAAEKGWISGYPDGTFRPMQNISRAEVITITNRMLNRVADEQFIKENKAEILNFTDLYPDYWAYQDIMEATNGHDYDREANGYSEIWTELNHKKFFYPVLD